MAKKKVVKRIAKVKSDDIEAPDKRSKYLYARIKEVNSDFVKEQAKLKDITVTQYVDLLLDKQRGA